MNLSANRTKTIVKNAAGIEIGRAVDLMIDRETGSVEYVVVSFRKALGMGDSLFAIPLTAIRVNNDNGTLVLDERRATLEKSAGFVLKKVNEPTKPLVNEVTLCETANA